MSDVEFDLAYKQAQDALRPELTESFLSTLVKAARTIGWDVDHTETCEFVKCCFGIAGKEAPTLDVFITI